MIKIRIENERDYLQGEKKKIGELNTRVMLMAENNNYTKCLEILQEAEKIDPYDPLTLLNKGHVLSQLGKYDQALQIYDVVIKNNPSSASAYYNKASCKANLGENEQALDFIEKAIELRPEIKNPIKKDNEFMMLRNHPRFQNLVGN